MAQTRVVPAADWALLLAAAAFGAGLVLVAYSWAVSALVAGLGSLLFFIGLKARRASHGLLKELPDLMVRINRRGDCRAFEGGRDIPALRDPAVFIAKLTEASMAHLERAFATGSTDSFECRLAADGELRDYEVRAVANDKDEVLLIVRDRAGKDGSEARDEALRQANEALEAIIENSPLAIFAMDTAGRVKSWNQAAERMFGWMEQEVLNERLAVLSGEDLGAFSTSEDAMRGGALAGIDARATRKDGTIAELSVWRAPLRDASGGVNGFITIAADITDHKSLERQFQKAQRMEAVGRLAGGVAHDFNNLLTVITGYGYMLLDDVEAHPGLRASVDEILRTVERGSALTNQLLTFSRRQIAEPKTIEINALVLNMDKMLRRVIGEDIEFVTALSPEAGRIKADRGQMEQAILNLLVNSRDAMPGGGKITIKTANAGLDEEHARILMVRPGEYVELSVIDTGHGMDEETRAHIFEPFFTTKEQGKGTGLGLAQVYGIVKQGDGEISVTSAPGKGTAVRMYFPRTFDAVEAESQEQGKADRPEGNETILLVEDEADVRCLVCEVLQQHGYTVLTSAQPQDAIEICETHAGLIDLLLTDVVLPQMSGRDLAGRICLARPHIRVLFMSGYTENAMPGACIPGSEEAFLKKPFTPAMLTQKIREVLDGQKKGLGAAAD